MHIGPPFTPTRAAAATRRTTRKIRQGLPKDKPRGPDGKVIRTPDGRIDWDKAGGGDRTGGVAELGGPGFQRLLEAPPADVSAEPKPQPGGGEMDNKPEKPAE